MRMHPFSPLSTNLHEITAYCSPFPADSRYIAAARDMCRTQITRSLLQPTCRTPLSLVIAIEQQAINASN